MLSKKKRVTKDLFQSIMKTGRVVQSPLFVFRYLPQKTPQFAFIAPKTVAKLAVDRNRLRRLGYNTLKILAQIPNCAGLFFYKKSTKTASFEEIKSDIKNILAKINT